MLDEASDLDEILTNLKSDRSEPRLPKSLRTSVHAGKVIADENHERRNDKTYSRTVKLQCNRCGSVWHACYEGPLPRHRSDLICYRCSR